MPSFRYTPAVKANIVRRALAGEVNQVMREHSMSMEELLSLSKKYRSFGQVGLRSTLTQVYRRE